MLWRRRVTCLCGLARRSCSDTPHTTTPAPSETPSAAASSVATTTPSNVGRSDLERQVERIAVRVPMLDRMVQQHDELIQLKERQRVVLERRLADLEESVGQLHSQIVEANRVAGQVALEQRNVDILLQGIEQRVLGQPCASVEDNVTTEEANKQEKSSSASDVHTSSVDAVQRSDVEVTTEVSSSITTPEEVLRGLRAVLADPTTRTELRRMLEELTQDTALATHSPVEERVPAEHVKEISVNEARQDAADIQAYHSLQASIQLLDAKLNKLQTQLALMASERVTLDSLTPAFTAAAQSSSLDRATSVVAHELRLDDNNKETSSTTTTSDGISATEKAARIRLRELLHYSGALLFKDIAGVTRLSTERILVRHVPANMSAAAVRELCLRCCNSVSSSNNNSSSKCDELNNSNIADYDEQGVVISCVARRMTSNAQDNVDSNERAFEVTFNSARMAIRALTALNALHGKSRAGQQTLLRSGPHAEPIVSADLSEALQHLHTVTQPLPNEAK